MAISNMPCANPACYLNAFRTSREGLCRQCADTWRHTRLPVAGFISSLDLAILGRAWLTTQRLTQSDTAVILRTLRGTRHPVGNWDERPAPRLMPLLHGRLNVRLPHILAGRRKQPSMRAFGMAVAHFALARSIIDAQGSYPAFLCGATMYNRRTVAAPPGDEMLKGDGKVQGYRLHQSDLSEVGRTVIKAAKAAGIDITSRAVVDDITDRYHRGLSAGEMHPMILLPPGTTPTPAGGDHPLDHRLPTSTREYPQPHGDAIRRCTGRIAGVYPEGLDVPRGENPKPVAQRSATPSAASAPPTPTSGTSAPPSTDWLFK